MTGLLDRLLVQLKARGLSIKPGRSPDELLLSGPDGAKTPELMEALKAFKPELLKRFQTASEVPLAHPALKQVEQLVPPPDVDHGKRCGECQRTIWLGNGVMHEDVWRTCDRLMCPYYDAAFDSSDWRANARRYELRIRDAARNAK